MHASRILRAVVLLWAAAVVAPACSGDAPFRFSGAVPTPAPEVGDLTLPDVSDLEPVDFGLRAADGGFLLLYWGYTSCPDICPTTMSDLAAARDDLGAEADRIRVAMATFDPERDTPQKLRAYVANFFADGIPLRADDPDALAAAMTRFGISAVAVDDVQSALGVLYDHTATVFVIDPAGRVVLEWPFGIEVDAIAADLEHLLAGDDPAAS